MKSSHRKKIEKAANALREVYEDLETEGKDDFEYFGERLEEIAAQIEEILDEDESNTRSEAEDEDE